MRAQTYHIAHRTHWNSRVAVSYPAEHAPYGRGMADIYGESAYPSGRIMRAQQFSALAHPGRILHRNISAAIRGEAAVPQLSPDPRLLTRARRSGMSALTESLGG